MSEEAVAEGEQFDDDALDVQISALEHFSYCARQCALIHVEQTFEENLFTVKGQIAHERVDTAGDTITRGVRVARSLPLWSTRYGLRGKSDVVEFRPEGPYPVEYKVGRRLGIHPDLQLCAQALCLEEMLGTEVQSGAIFYHATRQRHEVIFDAALRELTIHSIEAIRSMLTAQALPPAVNDARCRNCSLLNACLPSVVGEPHRLRGFQGIVFRPLDPTEAE